MSKEEIAKKLMDNIAYDNGAVDHWHPMKYPEKWKKKIGDAAEPFFKAHPQYLNDDDMEDMCNGEYSEIQEKFGKFGDYKPLDDVLNEYFNAI